MTEAHQYIFLWLIAVLLLIGFVILFFRQKRIIEKRSILDFDDEKSEKKEED